MPHLDTVYSTDFKTIEPHRRYSDTPLDTHDGYAVLIAHPQVGLAWLYMTNEQVARIIWGPK